jgi:hypothetical protein
MFAGKSKRRDREIGIGPNFGTLGMDWPQLVNCDRLRRYRSKQAGEIMKKHGFGALLCRYDENVRTLTPGLARLRPRLAMPCSAATARQSCLNWRHRHKHPKVCAVTSEGEYLALLCVDRLPLPRSLKFTEARYSMQCRKMLYRAPQDEERASCREYRARAIVDKAFGLWPPLGSSRLAARDVVAAERPDQGFAIAAPP